MGRMEDRWARRRDGRQEQAATPPWVPEDPAKGDGDPAGAGGAYAQPVATPVDPSAGSAGAGRRDWEYVVVQLPPAGKRVDAWTTMMNRVAAEGWRLVAVVDDRGPLGTFHYATFERRCGRG